VRVENKHDGYAPPWRPALTPPSWIDLRDQKFESDFLRPTSPYLQCMEAIPDDGDMDMPRSLARCRTTPRRSTAATPPSSPSPIATAISKR
jgi:hypothetical protein